MRFSIIIPTLNEAAGIGALVRSLRAQTDAELIISDGGSVDSTVAQAVAAGAVAWIASGRGRALQLNEGAAHASGEILYFLHADTLPPAGFLPAIQQALDTGTDAGCFRLRFDDRHPLLVLSAWCTRFPARIIRFGDQSLFVRTALFRELGGFRTDMPVMEDQELVNRLSRAVRFTILPQSVTTSARRYRENGVWRLQFLFTVIVTGYNLGVSPERLWRFYRWAIR